MVAIGLVKAMAVGMFLSVASGGSVIVEFGAGIASLVAYLAVVVFARRQTRRESHVLFEGLAIATIVGFAWHHLFSPVPLRGLDIHLAGFSVLMVFGRIGCFLGGCCYGVRSPFGVRYLLLATTVHPQAS